MAKKISRLSPIIQIIKPEKRIIVLILSLLLLTVSIRVGISLITRHSQISQQSKTSGDTPKPLPPEIKKQVQFATPSATFRIPILMYHYIEYVQDQNDKTRIALNIIPPILQKQIETLKNAGYTFITARELGEVLNGKRQLPQQPIILTFDDGYRDFYTYAFPLLKQEQTKATLYVVPGFLEGSNYLTHQQLEEIAKNGLIDIGAHTVHHVSLRQRSLSVVTQEITQSQVMLQDELHIPIVSFAYPYGTFDDQAIQVVKNSGFTTGVSTVPGISQSNTNRFFLYRLRPGARIGNTLLTWLQQNSFNPY